jgi:hypothetical protein
VDGAADGGEGAVIVNEWREGGWGPRKGAAGTAGAATATGGGG